MNLRGLVAILVLFPLVTTSVSPRFPSTTPSGLEPSEKGSVGESVIYRKWSLLGGAGTGLNDTVLDIEVADGVIFAGGWFEDAGGNANADYVAKYSNGAWSAVGTPLNLGGAVEDVEISDGVVYIAGYFTDAGSDPDADHVAKLSGGNWASVGAPITGLDGSVHTIEISDGIVYAGGLMSFSFDKDSPTIVMYKDGAWSEVGESIPSYYGEVWDIEIIAGDVYAAGDWFVGDGGHDFLRKYSGGVWTSLSGVWSEFDGTYTGLNSSVYDLEISEGVVYAGGYFTDAGHNPNADHIAKYSEGSWSAVGDPSSVLSDAVMDIELSNDVIYAAGYFENAGGDPNATFVAQFRDGSWSSVGEGMCLDCVSEVFEIEIVGDELLAGGNFEIIGGDANENNIAQVGLVAPPIPSQTILQAPARNALLIDYTPTFNWKDLANAYSFNLQVSTHSNLSVPVINQANILNSEYTPVKKLSPNRTYYWRVRAVNSAGQAGPWSAVWSFRTAYQPPALQTPKNNAKLNDQTPSFNWTNSAGASGYTIQFSQKPNFTKILKQVNVKQSDLTMPTLMKKNVTYFWRVRANGANGPSDWSVVWRFIIK